MKKPYVIAEMGVNFYDTALTEGITPLQAAFEYIDAAKAAGVDAAKFQSYKADTLVSRHSPAYWDLDKEPTKTQHALFLKHDGFTAKEYQQLCEHCRKAQIDFISTPFDYAAVDFLSELVDVFKISSSDCNNLPFIEYIAGKGNPIYLSVGASYLSEVEEAVRTMKRAGCSEICLLHCVLSYPCANQDANLAVIKTLKRIFPELKIGYSDHTLPDETMTILTTAYLYGAEIIEKHFTLDKTLKGNDHYHAGDPADFQRAMKNFELIAAVTGTGEKTVLPCEEISRLEARRSLVLVRDMAKGTTIQTQDIAAKRPGHGISPQFASVVAGRQVKADLPQDTVLTWDMI